MGQETKPPDCKVISAEETYRGKQGFDYFAGVSRESTSATGLCMHLLTIPPGARSRPHFHRRHETAIYLLSGEAGMWYGEGLKRHLKAHAGQFVYIPANVPHLAYNPSATVPVQAVVARTDPSEQESVEEYEAADPGVHE